MDAFDRYKPSVEIFSDPGSLAEKNIDIFVADALKAIEDHDCFRVAISGGSTPLEFFKLIGSNEKTLNLPWDCIHIFWVDERYVPPDSQWSNYKMAFDSFLSRIDIPEENVHRIPTEFADFQDAVKDYERQMREVFGIGEDELPEFDLIVLGMGADGHTASLFPNSYASLDTADLACVVYVLDEKLNRITLTYPVICAAKHITVMIAGPEKADILQTVMTTEPDEVRFPIHTLWAVLDKVTWLVDKEAAANISL